MLLKFKRNDSFKKKAVVISIWIYSIALLLMIIVNTLSMYLQGDTESLNLLFFSQITVGILILISLLFKSKIARFLILFNLYIALYLSIIYFIIILNFNPPFIQYIVQPLGILIILSLIYLFSNKKALELFKIDNLKKDLYWLIGTSFLFALISGIVYILNNHIDKIINI